MNAVVEDPHKYTYRSENPLTVVSNRKRTDMINRAQLIHKLPVEVLSWIFILGEGIMRESRASGQRCLGFQDLVTQVCRRWRDIAISIPKLWVYIFVSRPPPHPLAQLYISQSGSYPIVIDIDMRRPYVLPIGRFDHKEQAKRIFETFDYIIGYGGVIGRWRSLIVRSKLAQVLFDVIGFLSRTPTPQLQFLSLTWRSPSCTHQQRAVQYARNQLDKWGSCSLSRNSQRPQLRHVQFNELPGGFLLNRTSSMLSNLTEFVFINKQSHPPVQDISTFLSANPRLESLCLDTTAEVSGYPVPILLAPLQARMPLLRSFSLNAETNQEWCFQVLQIVDAPELEHFKLNIRVPYRSMCYYPAGKLVKYLGLGRLDGVLQCDMPADDTSYGSSIFPNLRHLDVEHVIGHYTGVPLLLQAFPSITQITLSLTCLQALAEHPELIPNASHFVYSGVSTGFVEPMRVVASCRASAGRRVSFLRVNISEPGLLQGILEEKSDKANGKHAISLGQSVDKVEIWRKGSEHVYLPDSDDEALSFEDAWETAELDIQVGWWTEDEDGTDDE